MSVKPKVSSSSEEDNSQKPKVVVRPQTSASGDQPTSSKPKPKTKPRTSAKPKMPPRKEGRIMQITIILFYVFGVLAAISALFIASTRNVIYAAFALILCFIALAGVYVFLGAEFIGITQILVYVGGILVLLVLLSC